MIGLILKTTVSLIAVLLFVVAGLLILFTVQAGNREHETRQQSAPPTGRFVPTGEIEIFVQEMGPANGPAVLFVHGTGAWSEMWREPMVALAAAGYHSLAIDMPPFGFSEKPLLPRYSSRDQAHRIIGIVCALGLRQVTLSEHSFGCRATVEAAVHLTHEMQSLVLIDAALGMTANNSPPAPPGWTTRSLKSVFGIPLIRQALVASTVTNPLLTRQLFQLLIDNPADATDALVEMLQRPLVVRDSTLRLGEWLQIFLFADDSSTLSSQPETYRTFAPPTLLLWGERDQLTPLAQGQMLASLLPDPTLVVLKGVGHIPQVEDVAQFTDALLRFLTVQVPAH
ncbi:MAG: alpha/beta hydrolase [Nitrospira sp.]|nr:alpha/beta hydrolase [Nitrospira sp.]